MRHLPVLLSCVWVLGAAAGAQAADGWYLMRPPPIVEDVVFPDGVTRRDAVINRDAPLSQWRLVSSFDSAQACEAYKDYSWQFSRKLAREAQGQFNAFMAERAAQDVLAYQCVAATDPRLTGGSSGPEPTTRPPKADAGSEWVLLHPPVFGTSGRGVTAGSFYFDDSAPLSLWNRPSDSYVTERLCLIARSKLVFGLEVLAAGIKGGYLKQETHPGSSTLLEWTRATQCVSTDDPRLVAAPTPQAPTAKPPEAATGGGSIIDDAIQKLLGPGLGTIRYTPGHPIIAVVRLNRRSTARLLLDTGADFSMVKPELLAAAGVDLSQPSARGKASGVTGKVQVSYFTVDFEVAGHRERVTHVAAFNTYDDNFADGLLGRDFLDRFKVVMDPAAGTVTLVPR